MVGALFTVVEMVGVVVQQCVPRALLDLSVCPEEGLTSKAGRQIPDMHIKCE